MSGAGFTADPDALDRAASGFERVAGQLASGIESFSASTRRVPPSVFGLTPAARSAWSAYSRTARESVAGLDDVRTTLSADIVGNLRATAGTYRAADDASAR